MFCFHVLIQHLLHKQRTKITHVLVFTVGRYLAAILCFLHALANTLAFNLDLDMPQTPLVWILLIIVCEGMDLPISLWIQLIIVCEGIDLPISLWIQLIIVCEGMDLPISLWIQLIIICERMDLPISLWPQLILSVRGWTYPFLSEYS